MHFSSLSPSTKFLIAISPPRKVPPPSPPPTLRKERLLLWGETNTKDLLGLILLTLCTLLMPEPEPGLHFSSTNRLQSQFDFQHRTRETPCVAVVGRRRICGQICNATRKSGWTYTLWTRIHRCLPKSVTIIHNFSKLKFRFRKKSYFSLLECISFFLISVLLLSVIFFVCEISWVFSISHFQWIRTYLINCVWWISADLIKWDLLIIKICGLLSDKIREEERLHKIMCWNEKLFSF